MAVRRCGLGALIAAAYQITNDHRRAHSAMLALLDEVLSEK